MGGLGGGVGRADKAGWFGVEDKRKAEQKNFPFLFGRLTKKRFFLFLF